jgi:hypothetical protein
VVFSEGRTTASPTGPTSRVFIVKFTKQLDVMR